MISVRTRTRDFLGKRMTQREINGIVRDAMYAAGEKWVKEYAPLHFEPGAVQRYGYRARKPRYLARKRRLGISRPLVWSGDLMVSLLYRPVSAWNIKATATSNRAQTKIPIKSPHPMAKRQFEEIAAMTRDETISLEKLVVQKIQEKIQK